MMAEAGLAMGVVRTMTELADTEWAEDRNVIIDVTRKAMTWLVDEGYDLQMGARPMARIIQENIKKPLADELLFGKLKSGGLVTVDLDKTGKLSFTYADDKPSKKSKKPSEKVN